MDINTSNSKNTIDSLGNSINELEDLVSSFTGKIVPGGGAGNYTGSRSVENYCAGAGGKRIIIGKILSDSQGS